MTLRWRYHPGEEALEQQIARSVALSPIAARLLVNRGIRSAAAAQDFLTPELSSLTDPFRMRDMERAVDRLQATLKAREHIVVYGDSDVDGVSGTALLAGFLRAIQANVSTYIPNRLEEGYSLTPRGLAEIERRGAKLVIAVDNGTSAAAAIARLAAADVDVIVCDHHEPPPLAPKPLAFLNPKWESCGYPFPFLCGTAVAFQLLAALATRLPASQARADALDSLLRDCVAFAGIATICDCVPLIGENRSLARAGLAALNDTEHPGLRALLETSGVGRSVQTDDISFRLGPRLNAAGRLGHAGQALDLLLARNPEEANALAQELDRLNAARQELEAHILADARRRAQREADAGAPIVLLADEAWHAGVVGIVAARVAAEFQRPAVLIALKDGRARGSGRSFGGFDLYRALMACSEHLTSFGGHAFAAGLELAADRVDAFREQLLAVANAGPPRATEHDLLIDAEVPLGVLNPSLMAEINRLAPFGEGLAVPVFAADRLELDGPPRVVGKTQNHLSFSVKQSGVTRKAIGFGMSPLAERLRSSGRFALAFTPRLNVFHGRVSVDLEVRDFQLSAPT